MTNISKRGNLVDARLFGAALFVVVVPMEYVRYFVLASYPDLITWAYLYLVYLFAATALIVAYVSAKGVPADFYRLVFWCFWLYTATFPILWYAASDTTLSDALRSEIADYYVRVGVLNLLHFLTGWYLFDVQRWRSVLGLLFAGAMGLTLVNIDLSVWKFRAGGIIEELGYYIVLGDALALFSFFVMALFPGFFARFGTLVLTAIVLLLLGSRTSFYVYLAAVVISFAMVDWGGKKVWLHAAVLAVLSSSVILLSGFSFAEYLSRIDWEGIRVLRVLFTDEDTSLSSREILLLEGLRVIANNPLFGEFASDYRVFGESGWYIHNYLEVWRQFGLLPFVAVVYLVGMAWREYFRFIKDLRTPEAAFIGMALAFLTLEIISARSYGYPQIFLIVGMVARLRVTRSAVRRADAELGLRQRMSVVGAGTLKVGS